MVDACLVDSYGNFPYGGEGAWNGGFGGGLGKFFFFLSLYPEYEEKTKQKNHTNHIMIHTQGLANFTITLITPILFNNLYFYIYLIFAATNLFAGVWTYLYSPETGGRSFEENQEFFEDAKSEGTWRVAKIDEGEFCWLPYPKSDGGEESGESQPLLRRVRDQVTS